MYVVVLVLSRFCKSLCKKKKMEQKYNYKDKHEKKMQFLKVDFTDWYPLFRYFPLQVIRIIGRAVERPYSNPLIISITALIIAQTGTKLS